MMTPTGLSGNSTSLICYLILREISPGISLEGMMLKLKLQCFGHLMRRVDSLEKTLMLGGIGGRRRRGRQRMRWLGKLKGRTVWILAQQKLHITSEGIGSERRAENRRGRAIPDSRSPGS